ncbi:Nicotinate-nucleotide--dimethylbenzimidazole phosphoribosyltransferase [Roseibaca ekhonensis]|jgi:nicotinate-nucleotide--dimethylbenzimidazole phosphoribosyltransferase|uniref:Nicotinate-nucleotide--dimethylbenzimidazole phosphoribosyltransferase n=1 Tax=Roseinatronobacter ekhonensis TaxID=254356 RepID=A0A3B0MCR2_9RHOB|nr:nicotinate-nucleotide--dimethylbenzimidazole phosphoribosyltransferase [Roseibaca ekhonensis]SUZ31498.1 Nicotinate-nucleotide--dimethylbenzimidazole phosphoribosyltransferase [Roseibaca ekhonensis]
MTSQPHRLSDAEIQSFIDAKTKPLGALGRIETLAAQIARFRNTLTPRVDTCELVIFAADHGIAAEGVSAFPQAVTQQMVLNFLAGGAAANAFARSLGIPVHVVDAGVAGEPLDAPALWSYRIAPGTESSLRGPAMSSAELAQAWQTGAEIVGRTQAQALAFGEMGIGNTASASLLAHKLTGLPLDTLVGRGTGVDPAGLAHKRAVLGDAAARTDTTLSVDTALAEYAGFEMAMMAGAMQAAAEDGRMVLVDGFIATASAAAALARAPHIRPAMVFCHRSQEAGHRVLLDWLNADPLLDMDMRLGEGTGALLAWPLVKAASAMLCDMASFDSAGVSQG